MILEKMDRVLVTLIIPSEFVSLRIFSKPSGPPLSYAIFRCWYNKPDCAIFFNIYFERQFDSGCRDPKHSSVFDL